MTTTEVKVPTLGETITTVKIVRWHLSDGQGVRAGDHLLDVENDKALTTVTADAAGTLRTIFPAGAEVQVGDVVATIDAPRGRFVTEWVGDSPSLVDGLAAAYNRLDGEGYDVVNVVPIQGWEFAEQLAVDANQPIAATQTDGLIVVGRAREKTTAPESAPDAYKPLPFHPSHAAELL